MLQKTLYWTGRTMVGSYAHTMLRMDVHYHTPLPAGAKIIALNHPTTTDPFLSTMLAGERVNILVSETLFKVPVFGGYLRRSGHIPVVVGSGRTAFDEARRLLLAGGTIVIFPEGAISPPEGGFQKAHSGTARLALLTGAPVIPVGIHLLRERIRYIHTTVDDQPEVARWYFRGPYAMTVGVPLYFRGDVEDHAYVQAITTHIMDSIMVLSAQGEKRLAEKAASRPRKDLRLQVRQASESTARLWAGLAREARHQQIQRKLRLNAPRFDAQVVVLQRAVNVFELFEGEVTRLVGGFVGDKFRARAQRFGQTLASTVQQ